MKGQYHGLHPDLVKERQGQYARATKQELPPPPEVVEIPWLKELYAQVTPTKEK